MKKDVYISIKGSQAYEDDQNKMEVTTAGKFYDKDGKYYVATDRWQNLTNVEVNEKHGNIRRADT